MKRLRGIPNVTLADAQDWIETSMHEHSLPLDNEVPPRLERLILLYAEADAVQNIAVRTAHYFEFKDGEESADKRAVSEQYRKLATELRRQYRERRFALGFGSNGARSGVMTRIDRP